MSSAMIAAAAAARHARYLPASLGCRALGCSSASGTASQLSTSSLSQTQVVGSSIPSSGSFNAHTTLNTSNSLLNLAAATSLAAAFSISSLDNNIAFCETAAGPADEMEENDDGFVVVKDGMDAGADTSSPDSPTDAGPADAEEDDEDDPFNDEDTSCSICLINRQGPCRKYWLKFERCMKEHSAEKENTIAEEESKAPEDAINEEASDDVDDNLTEQDEMERGWDAFMEKSIRPGEDDDDDEDDEDDNEEDEEEDQDNDENESGEEGISEQEEMTLAERCDKFMIPWIGCIQTNRNIYSLISNDFYQKDYVDPLEDAVLESNRQQFSKSNAEIGENDGYVIKFNGVEVDLGNWREHVEADADVDSGDVIDEEETPSIPNGDEPHLINAYAKFQLTDPESGEQIEVAYIRDQKGRLLGFDSFTKKKSSDDENVDDESSNEDDERADESNEGECTFHLVPGETTIITAYAIYRGRRGDDGDSVREDNLYYTSEIPLPGQSRS